MSQSMSYQDLQIIERKIVYDGYFKIEKLRLKFRLFSGEWSPEIDRELFQRGHAVGLLLFDPQLEQVVLIEEFRAGAIDDTANRKSPWLLQLVAGVIEPNEAVEEVARRECLEEAGLAVKELLPITRYFASPGGSTESVTLFCGKVDASIAGGVYGMADEGENIKVCIIPVADAFAKVANNEICDALSIIGLQWLQLNYEKVKKQLS